MTDGGDIISIFCFCFNFFREKLLKLDDIKKNIRDAILVSLFLSKFLLLLLLSLLLLNRQYVLKWKN